MLEVHVKGTLVVGMTSRATVVRICTTAPRTEHLMNVSSVEAKSDATTVLVFSGEAIPSVAGIKQKFVGIFSQEK